MRNRILFVDDDLGALQGLRQTLHAFVDDWDMTFAEGAEQALDALAGGPFDVVVTDIRLRGMTGTGLLEKVKTQYPDVLRFILSGQSSEDSMLATVGPAHQFLSKPCDPTVLKATVLRACALREVLAEPRLQRLVSKLGSLPSPPKLYMDLVAELNSRNPSILRVADCIAEDAGMVARLLRLVNSAFFGFPMRISDPHHAASLLGLNAVTALVLSVKVFSEHDAATLKSLGLSGLMDHCLRVGHFAKAIAQYEGLSRQDVDDAFTAGLLHDVGRLILASSLPTEYKKVAAAVGKGGSPVCEAEWTTFGASHAEVGAYLIGLWGFPDSIVEALAFHHEPRVGLHSGIRPVATVHVADVFATQHEPAGTPVAEDYLAAAGLTAKLDQWRIACGVPSPEAAQAAG
jgi:putative nucleotidyltransferase with HDIG domain